MHRNSSPRFLTTPQYCPIDQPNILLVGVVFVKWVSSLWQKLLGEAHQQLKKNSKATLLFIYSYFPYQAHQRTTSTNAQLSSLQQTFSQKLPSYQWFSIYLMFYHKSKSKNCNKLRYILYSIFCHVLFCVFGKLFLLETTKQLKHLISILRKIGKQAGLQEE